MKSANLNSKDPFYPSNHQHPISKISKAEIDGCFLAFITIACLVK
jgi:hypothetical protein